MPADSVQKSRLHRNIDIDPKVGVSNEENTDIKQVKNIRLNGFITPLNLQPGNQDFDKSYVQHSNEERLY